MGTTLFTQLLISLSVVLMLKNAAFLETLIISSSLLVFTVSSLIIYTSYYKNPDWERLFAAFRLQRHDFQNHLQVISSMIQLGKYDMALNYICDVKYNNEVIYKICSLRDKTLISVLLEIVCCLKQKDIDLKVEIYDENLPKPNINRLQKEMKMHISKFGGFQGKKDITMVLKNSEFEIYSPNGDTSIM